MNFGPAGLRPRDNRARAARRSNSDERVQKCSPFRRYEFLRKPADTKQDDPVFSSATGRPDGAMLEKLKQVAHRAKLNCGYCAVKHNLENGTVKINRCSGGPYCTRWFLHKFRHTYATRHLQDGIDIRTLQQWMGHRDIASTMVYLKGLRNKDVQQRINTGSLAAFA